MKIYLNIFQVSLFLFLLLLSENGFTQERNNQSFDNNPAVPSMATWHMDSSTIDLAATYSPFSVLVNLRSLGRDKDLMDNNVHDEIKKLAAYAKQRNVSLVADLDVRLALSTFEARYPDDLQQMLVVREIDLRKSNNLDVSFISRKLQDHYHRPYPVRSGAFIKAYAYNLTREGVIDPHSLKEISKECILKTTTKNAIELELPGNIANSSSHAFVIVSFTYLYPDLFSPHLKEFHREIIRKYADTGLAGAHNDEWGFPAALSEEFVRNEYWYTKNRAEAYGKITGGRILIDDILLMKKGIAGKEEERLKAINYFQEMGRVRNIELEDSFYKTVKETFGSEAIVGVHPTWFPYPDSREYKKNGLNWWAVKRDWAQTDEVTPFAVRTSLAKKWNSPVWYNMYYRYDKSLEIENADDYLEELWSAALAGGRVNNLPSVVGINGILRSAFIRAETRVRLLNYINPTPLNCPVAVVFGHASAMNWAGPAYEDVGMDLVNSLWRLGIPVDLIPSTEIENNSLIVDPDGYIRYGNQCYAAVVLYNPEFEKTGTATFFNRAAQGKTRLYRIGDWTRDFQGSRLDGNNLLPEPLRESSKVELILPEIFQLLKEKDIPLHTPASRLIKGFGHESYAPPTTGFSYLLDGTLLQIAATQDRTGDTIKSKMKIGEYDVSIDAIGVAAVRLDQDGELEALAAGGLKSLETDKFKLCLDERLDLAIWKNEEGDWHGVIQGLKGEIPRSLLAITSNWKYLDLPMPYTGMLEKRINNQ